MPLLVTGAGIGEYTWNMPASPVGIQHTTDMWFRSDTPITE